MRKIYFHPLPLRIWHWANALIVILLLITGAEIRIPGVAALPVNSAALIAHRYLGWAMTVCFLFWLVYTLKAPNLRRQYVIGRQDFKGACRQGWFYLFSIFKGQEHPFRPSPDEKFNPLQKFAYGSIVFILAPVILITGFLFSTILPLRKYISLHNAMKATDAIHIGVAYVFILYLVMHIYMSTLGRNPLSHIKAMIVGYEEEPEESRTMEDDKKPPDQPEVGVSHPSVKAAGASPEEAVAGRECPDGQEGEKNHG
jgi:thiosulfate reductase cytochrome b subunit